jgi:hypothetical protein
LSCQLFTGSRPPKPTTYLPKAAVDLERSAIFLRHVCR